MTIIITFSDVSGGDSVNDTIDIGPSITPGDTTSIQNIFIRHDAVVAPITNCAFYITRYAGGAYQGEDADADYTEIMSWGDNGPDTGGTDPAAKISQKIPAGWTINDEFDFETDSNNFKTTSGDINNQFELDKDSIVGGGSTDGEIPVGGEAHIQFKIDTPEVSEITRSAGYRAISLVFSYSATS